MIDEKTGYIKLNSFSRTSTREMQYAISKPKEGMKKLILDLQDNGGGLLLMLLKTLQMNFYPMTN